MSKKVMRRVSPDKYAGGEIAAMARGRPWHHHGMARSSGILAIGEEEVIAQNWVSDKTR